MAPRRTTLITKMLTPISRVRGGLTLGAQGVLIDPKDRVLLVRHTYRPGWFFPGGGVEWGEPIEAALARELEEEVGAKLLAPPHLHGVFANFASFPGDHIAVFVARHWERADVRRDNSEIAEVGLFEGRCLPEATDAGTRRRLQEIFDRLPKTALWA
jgi:ADP-ribose pyrophosphatase YjhB (NUDIX family)